MTPGHRVLVVDEIYLIAMDIQRILGEGLNCDVVCMDVAEAEAAEITEPFSAVIFDNGLYPSTGQRVKDLLSGHLDRLLWTTTDAVAAGSHHFDPPAMAISKPFDEERIIEIVREMIFPGGASGG